jgi:hypothetical protein
MIRSERLAAYLARENGYQRPAVLVIALWGTKGTMLSITLKCATTLLALVLLPAC